MARAFLGVGSNIQPERSVERTLQLLTEAPAVTLTGISTFFRTPALPNPHAPPQVPKPRYPDFLNGVLEVSTNLPPQGLEALLGRIEDALGRRRQEDKYAPRTLDLDLLLYLPDEATESVLESNQRFAQRTHPDVFSRGFVAFPLFELAPELSLPPDDNPLAQVVEALDGPGGEPEPRFTKNLRRRFL
jgi:2-amino-4-hydroxy-6-hydroxymethyldihydropteridine diphosphokinase